MSNFPSALSPIRIGHHATTPVSMLGFRARVALSDLLPRGYPLDPTKGRDVPTDILPPERPLRWGDVLG